MAARELWRLSATELQRRYRDGSLTPLEVAQACLARLEDLLAGRAAEPAAPA